MMKPFPASAATKPFSRKLHDQNDEPAKNAVWRYLFNCWNVEVEEGDTFGIDLVCYRDRELVGYVEVERRHNWVDEFPFTTVHVPFRKQKFLSLDKPMTLFSVRSDLTQALWCPGEDIKNSPIEVKSNKFVSEEKFYVVPIEKWRKVCLP
jgi:hypothetical protein